MRRSGFTIIETLVVIALMGLLALLSAPFLSDAPGRSDLNNLSAEAVDALREAQAATMSGKNNARYGVHFQFNRFTYFEGATYSAGDTNNIVHAFPTRVTVTAVTLSPGGACTVATGVGNCDVHFADRRGTPTETGTIIFSDGVSSKTVTVGAAGMISVN